MLLAEFGTWAEWGVVLATLLLALATFALAIVARGQSKVAAEHVVAIQRPLVLPVVTGAWLEAWSRQQWIAVKNVGLGPAYNVQGGLYWLGGAGGASGLQKTTLAAGEEGSTRVVGEGINIMWENASGFLRYLDSAGVEWQTPFRYRAVPTAGIEVESVEVGLSSDLGEPRYSGEGRAP
jgi:hypothetical protein